MFIIIERVGIWVDSDWHWTERYWPFERDIVQSTITHHCKHEKPSGIGILSTGLFYLKGYWRRSLKKKVNENSLSEEIPYLIWANESEGERMGYIYIYISVHLFEHLFPMKAKQDILTKINKYILNIIRLFLLHISISTKALTAYKYK